MNVITQPSDRLFIDADRPIKAGVVLTMLGLFGFLIFAAFAPLTSAAVAPGIVVADSRNKTIQHLEGGILRAVLVHEGDRVVAGQLLARLDSISANANLGRLRSAQVSAVAQESRLLAERDARQDILFPSELLAASSDPDASNAMQGQQSLFEAHRSAQQSEQAIMEQRIAQAGEEIKGIEAEVQSEDRQLELIAIEMKDVRALVAQGLERKTRLLQLERSDAELSGHRGRNLADIARARQNIAELQQRLVNIKAQHTEETDKDLRETQTKVADLDQQITAAADTSRRLDVIAPVPGKVVSIYHGTPGGVLKPGETIMELLPDQDQLLIEAQVRPEDIDDIAAAATARVRLTGYSQRRTSSLKGRVETVSADRIVDPHGEKAHFLARVAVDMDAISKEEGLKLYPGMPAIVYIETGRQSLLSYLLAPLFSGMERGLKER